MNLDSLMDRIDRAYRIETLSSAHVIDLGYRTLQWSPLVARGKAPPSGDIETLDLIAVLGCTVGLRLPIERRIGKECWTMAISTFVYRIDELPKAAR